MKTTLMKTSLVLGLGLTVASAFADGLVRNHADTVAAGGVGNYVFRTDHVIRSDHTAKPGYVLDHDATKAKCGVGNYVFRNERCVEQPTVTAYEDFESEDDLSMGSSLPDYAASFNTKTFLFSNGSSRLSKSDQAEVGRVARYLRARPDMRVEIVGYADSTGSDQANRRLSEKRANAVASELKRRGVDSSQVATVSRAASDPVADNSTLEGRALNRRVEMKFYD